ncbi:hypothetical protein B0I37DRAFT_30213 [Chaetomium sp. MPI-CAGE-AT-0009]|nr:hypothetical protein B0I37DRAFT_30213 [Chaetomium sp. MPI-CAGE-AT-0009]
MTRVNARPIGALSRFSPVSTARTEPNRKPSVDREKFCNEEGTGRGGHLPGHTPSPRPIKWADGWMTAKRSAMFLVETQKHMLLFFF